MTRRADLERAARTMARILGPTDCLLVGGLAVAAHGYVRGTQDVDFVARAPLAEVRARLRAEGIPATLLQGDAMEGDPPCLKATLQGIRVDVMPPLVALDWEKAIPVPLGTKRDVVRVVDLDGLIHLKMKAHGPKDLMDVSALILLHPEKRGLALELATAYRVNDKLSLWLEDRRLQAEIRETRAMERRGPLRRRRARRPRSR